MMRLAWVAGGAGFIGSHLVESLLADGWRVIVLDDLSTGRLENLPTHPELASMGCDVARAIPPVPRPDVVYHLASPASPAAYYARPVETIEANTTGTLNLLRAIEHTSARLVFSSSSEVYGNPTTLRQTENDPLRLEAVSDRAPYAMAKAMGEVIVRQWSEATTVRLFNVYGPRMSKNDGRCIPEFIDAALNGRPIDVHGDGLQGRAFTYVSDAVRMLRKVGEADLSGPTVNIGNPTVETSITELAQLILRLTGHKSRVIYSAARDFDPRHRLPDIKLFERIHGLQSFVRLVDGLTRTIDSMKGETT